MTSTSFALSFVLASCAHCEPGGDGGAGSEAPATARVMTRVEDLIPGPCATGALGDIELENGLARAVITRGDVRNGFAATAGNLIDAAAREDGRDLVNEMFLYLDDDFPRQGRYETVEILSPGGGGKPAIVRASGTDSKDPRIRIETDYRLERGEQWITIESRFTSTATTTIGRYRIGDVIQWGRARGFVPGLVRRRGGDRKDADWVGGIGDRASYALVPDRGQKLEPILGAMWSDVIGLVVDLGPNQTAIYRRHLVIGRGDTASLAPAIARLRGDPTGRLRGRVRDPNGKVIQGAGVLIEREDGAPFGVATVDPSGRYAIDLLPGAYRASAFAPGSASAEARPIAIRAGETTEQDLALGGRATLAWRIEDEGGGAIPIKVTVTGIEGTPSPGLGPAFEGGGADRFVLSRRGEGEIPLRPGRYRIAASRGPEIELFERTVTATAGGKVELRGRLTRAFTTPGFISADLHQHAVPSFDSGVTLEDRVLANATEGLGVAVSTDHNVLTDYQPVIEKLGLGRTLASIVGTEATTHSVGHFNALPLRYRAEKPRGGMFDPEGMTPRRIFDRIRTLGQGADPPYIHVSHPRAGKIGYFDLMGLDPMTGLAGDDRYVTDFDGLEVVIFGSGLDTRRGLVDWFALLLRGLRITAVGGSDTHTISDRQVGWPRTYVCVEHDEPERLDVRQFTASLKRGCATVSGGPFVTIEGRAGERAAQMGGLLRAESGRFSVRVVVKAAGWVPTDRLSLFVNGRAEAPIAIGGTGAIRFDQTIPLSCTEDCFVVAMVDADRDLSSVLAKRPGLDPRPIALTNPIYVDVDGDGRFLPRPKQP